MFIQSLEARVILHSSSFQIILHNLQLKTDSYWVKVKNGRVILTLNQSIYQYFHFYFYLASYSKLIEIYKNPFLMIFNEKKEYPRGGAYRKYML